MPVSERYSTHPEIHSYVVPKDLWVDGVLHTVYRAEYHEGRGCVLFIGTPDAGRPYMAVVFPYKGDEWTAWYGEGKHFTRVVSAMEEAVSEEKEVAPKKKEMVDHPDHYGGKDNPYEVIKVIEAWSVQWVQFPQVIFSLASAMKYMGRVGKKGVTREEMQEDLRKAAWFILRAAEKI